MAERRHLRTGSRLASLLAYGLSFVILAHVQPIAAKAYNDLCASQGMSFGEGEAIRTLAITLIVIAVPLGLARSSILVYGNLIISLLILLCAYRLLSTAGNTPYECFTQAGTYEDNTSGIDDFEWGLAVVVAVSYLCLLVDLAIWMMQKGFSRKAFDWSR
jgi:hypothetical protein